jgi:predicted metal-dependent HD superfamily phosphohydrolase
VRVFILATKEHKGEGLTKDGKLFLDADLFILGTPEDIYKEYSKAIRKEYGWVPSFLYKRGRKKLLENFIKRDRIYFTDEMFEMFEIKARQNIVEELVSLTK